MNVFKKKKLFNQPVISFKVNHLTFLLLFFSKKGSKSSISLFWDTCPLSYLTGSLSYNFSKLHHLQPPIVNTLVLLKGALRGSDNSWTHTGSQCCFHSSHSAWLVNPLFYILTKGGSPAPAQYPHPFVSSEKKSENSLSVLDLWEN